MKSQRSERQFFARGRETSRPFFTPQLLSPVAADFALAIDAFVARWNTAAGAVAAEHIRVVGVGIAAAVRLTSLTLLKLAIKHTPLLTFVPLVANRTVRRGRVREAAHRPAGNNTDNHQTTQQPR